MTEPLRIVAVRLSALGDVLLATPALHALKERFPRSHLTFLTDAAYAPLLEGLPWLDEVAVFRRGDHRSTGGALRLARELRRNGPIDLFIDFQHKARTALLGTLLRPKRRIALQKRTASQTLAALAGREEPRKGPHASRLYFQPFASLDIVPPAGDLPISPLVSLQDEALAQTAGLLGDQPSPLVGLAPGAKWETKRWSPQRFGELGRRLKEELGGGLVLVGGPGDESLIAGCAEAMGAPAVPTTLGLDLPGMAAVLSRCALVVAGDTGPAHLACALGRPVVSLFGPTSSERWGPSSPGSRVVRLALECMPCSNHGDAACPLGHHRCMVDIDVERVFREAARILPGRPPETARFPRRPLA